ncbi:MAG TPA: FAD-dependent oxidoreductase [Gammaproteobacteria bacterium]
MSERSVHIDVAIFGGGVAGLWLLARLRKLGYQAVLFEAQALGAGQTRHAQGIIHGGTKYALTGKLTGSSESIAEMPGIWRAALNGDGELDLRAAKLLSPHQFMWSTESLTSRMAGFFASKLMKSRTASVEGEGRPQVLRDHHFKGHVYRLDEPVLDVASLILALAEPHHAAIYQLPDDEHYQIEQRGGAWHVRLGNGESVEFAARRVVFAAGKGNAALLKKIGRETPAMQLRPLQMVMVRGSRQAPLPGELYAHCLGASANPRITITTHYDAQGNTVWYLGGQIAEEGVGRSREAQIAAAKKELSELLPWLDLSQAQWGVLPIDRAEVKMADGSRPDNVYFAEQDGVITAWPTKLALAPRLARQIIEALERDGITPGEHVALPQWPHPGYALLPWQEEERWS